MLYTRSTSTLYLGENMYSDVDKVVKFNGGSLKLCVL